MTDLNGYKKLNEGKGLVDLIKERKKLLKEITEFEENHILDCQPYNYEEVMKPDPKTIYFMNNQYLIVITELITSFITRSKNKFVYQPGEIEFIEGNK